MPQPFRRVLQVAGSLVLMAGLLYWAFDGVDLRDVAARIGSLPGRWFAIIVLLNLFALVARGWRWTLLMRPFAPQVTWLDASLALSICYTANIPLPRSGEFLRAVSLRWTRQASITATLATVVVERILDIAWLMVFAGVSLLLLRGRLEAVIPGVGLICAVILSVCIGLLVLLGIVSLHREQALCLLIPPLQHLPPRLADRAVSLVRAFLHGLQALHSRSAYLRILASSIVLELGYTAIVWAAFHGFGLTESYSLGSGAAVVTMALSSMGAMVPTPGAAGSYHALFAKPLVLLYAVDPHDALACATAVHAIATLTYVAIGVPAFLAQRRAASRRDAAPGAGGGPLSTSGPTLP